MRGENTGNFHNPEHAARPPIAVVLGESTVKFHDFEELFENPSDRKGLAYVHQFPEHPAIHSIAVRYEANAPTGESPNASPGLGWTGNIRLKSVASTQANKVGVSLRPLPGEDNTVDVGNGVKGKLLGEGVVGVLGRTGMRTHTWLLVDDVEFAVYCGMNITVSNNLSVDGIKVEPPPTHEMTNERIARAFAKAFMTTVNICNDIIPKPPLRARPVPRKRSFIDKLLNGEEVTQPALPTQRQYHPLKLKDMNLIYNFRNTRPFAPSIPRPTKQSPLDKAQSYSPSQDKLTSAIDKMLEASPDQPENPEPRIGPPQKEAARDKNLPGTIIANEGVILKMVPKYGLDQVGGLDKIRSEFQDIALGLSNPELLKTWGVSPPNGVILYGEPGTGKTMLAHALAHETQSELWIVNCAELYNKWLGDSAKNFNHLFGDIQRYKGRLVVLFDELDSIVSIQERPGSGGADAERNTVAGIFKTSMDRLASENLNVLVVGTTNNLDRLDPALIRAGRFDYKIYVPMPTETARGEIIAVKFTELMSRSNLDQEIVGMDIDIPALAKASEGMSGAELEEVFNRVKRKKAMEHLRTGQASIIAQKDVLDSIIEFKRFG